MSYAAWKTLERYWAKVEGGVRLWRQDYSESIPDGENERATWDTKCWAAARLPGWNLYWKQRDKYKDYSAGRHFKLVLRAPGARRGALVLMHEDEYLELLQGVTDGTTELSGVRDQREGSVGQEHVCPTPVRPAA